MATLELSPRGALLERLGHGGVIPPVTRPQSRPEHASCHLRCQQLTWRVDEPDHSEECPAEARVVRRTGKQPGQVTVEQPQLEYMEDALTWDEGMRPEWSPWEEWHATTARSTGFHALDEPPPLPVDDPRLREAHRRALPVYERLRKHALSR